MTTLFGRRVIGDKAYEEQQRMVEEGRFHFGPRVIGHPPSYHGKEVVGNEQAAEQQLVSEVTGLMGQLEELKHGELKAICDKLTIEYKPVGEPNVSLIAKIRAKYAELGGQLPTEPTEKPPVNATDLAHADAEAFYTLLDRVTAKQILEEAYHLDDREWALDAYARRSQELADGHTTK